MAEPLAVAEVGITVSMEQLDRGLASARNRLNQFDQDTTKSQGPLKALEEASIRTSEAVEALTEEMAKQQKAAGQQAESVMKASGAVDDFTKSTRAAVDSINSANDNLQKSGRTALESAEHFASAAQHLWKWYGYIGLAVAVAQKAFPAIGQATEKVATGLGKAAESAGKFLPAAEKSSAALGKVTTAAEAVGLGGVTAAFGSATTAAVNFGSKTSGALGTVIAATAPIRAVGEAVGIAGLAGSMGTASAAAYALSPALRGVVHEQILTGFKNLPAAIGTIAPVAKEAGVAVGNFLLPRIQSLLPAAAAILAVATAFKATLALFEIGKNKVAALTDELTGMAAGAGVSREFFERLTKSAKDFKLSSESAGEALAKFNEVSAEKLGGSEFDETLKKLQEAGNFVDNAGAASYKMAQTTEERYKAVVQLITEAGAKGERLAALELAKTFLPPDMLSRLKASTDFLQVWQARAEAIEKKKLADPAMISWALELKGRMDEVQKTFRELWEGDLPALERAGMGIYGVWVLIVEKLAQAAKYANDFVGKEWERTASDFSTIGKEAKQFSDNLNYIDKVLAVVEREVGRAMGGEYVVAGVHALEDFVSKLLTVKTATGGVKDTWESASGFVAKATKAVSDYVSQLEIVKRLSTGGDLNSWITQGLQSLRDYVNELDFVKRVSAGIAEIKSTSGAPAGVPEAAAAQAVAMAGLEAEQAQVVVLTKAYNDLKLAMRVPETVNQATANTQRMYEDVSHIIDGATKSFERLKEQIKRHTIEMDAQAQTAGKSAGEAEKLRVEMLLTAAAAELMAKGITISAKEIQDLADAAGIAAQNLARARLEAEHKTEDLGANQRIRALQLEAATIGQTAGQRAKATLEQKAQFKVEQEALKLTGDATKIDKDRLGVLTDQADKEAALTKSIEGANKAYEVMKEIKFERETVGLSEADTEIAQKLKGIYDNVDDSLKSHYASLIKVNQAIRTLGTELGNFGNDFVSGMVQGETAVKSLQSALTNLGSSITRSSITDLGKQIAGSIGDATKNLGASLGSSLSSMLGLGSSLGSLGGPLGSAAGAAIGIGISYISKLFGGKDNSAEQQKAQQAAAEAERQRQARELMVAEAQQRAADYTLRAAEAMGKTDFTIKMQRFDLESQQAFDAESKRAGDLAIWQLVAARAAERAAMITDTISSALDVLSGKKLSDVEQQMKDIAQASSDLREALIAQGSSVDEVLGKTIDAILAVGASSLQLPEELSKVQTSIAEFTGNAAALQKALVDLGAAGGEASAIIDNELTAALAKLAGSFLGDITRQINELAGGAWINQAEDLSAKVVQMRADAAALGVSAASIDTLFLLSAQKIIDDNKLTGESFNRLEAVLGLAGAGLHEFNTALEDTAKAVKRTTDEINATVQGYQDDLFKLVQDQTTLQGKLAIFDLDAQRQREAEITKGGEALAALTALQEGQRTKIITDYAKEQADALQKQLDDQTKAQQQAADEAARIWQQAVDLIEAARVRITQFIASFMSSTQSFLSPLQRMQAAQTSFTQQLTAARGGDKEALQNITSSAQDALNAIKAYYGSSSTGVSLQQQILSSLSGLPSQLSPEEFIANAIKDQTTTQSTEASAQLGQLQAQVTALAAQLTQLTTVKTNTNTLPTNIPLVVGNTGDTVQALTALAEISLNTGSTTTLLGQAVGYLFNIQDHTFAMRRDMAQQNVFWGQTLSLPSFQTGGPVTGPATLPGRDSVQSRLAPGEFVIRPEVALNNPWLDKFNQTGKLPMLVLPSAGNDNSSILNELRMLRNQLLAAVQEQTYVAESGHANTVDSIERGNSALGDMAQRSRLSTARNRSAA